MLFNSGNRIGSWVLVERLGVGRQGETWRAEHTETGQSSALKISGSATRVVASELAADVAAWEESLAIERRVERATVRVLDWGVLEGGHRWVARELVQGQSLASVLEGRGTLDATEVRVLGQRVAEVLQYAHELGVLHRDIKPSNLMVPVDGGRLAFERTVVIDFGVAERLVAQTGQTQAGVIAGSPAYMAPEQLVGAEQGPAADIYQLSVVLWECLEGHLPFTGLRALLEEAPTPPSAPSPLADAIVGGMQKSPNARHGSMEAYRKALARAIETPEGVLGWEVGGWPTSDGPVSDGPVSGGPVSGEPVSGGPSGGRIPGVGYLQMTAGGGLALVLAVVLLLVPLSGAPPILPTLAVGVLVGGGAYAVLRRWSTVHSSIPETVGHKAHQARVAISRSDLQRYSIAVRVEELVSSLREDSASVGLLTDTVKLNLDELGKAEGFEQRVAVLKELGPLLLRLEERASERRRPSLVRHKELVAVLASITSMGVSIVGLQPHLLTSLLSTSSELAIGGCPLAPIGPGVPVTLTAVGIPSHEAASWTVDGTEQSVSPALVWTAPKEAGRSYITLVAGGTSASCVILVEAR